MNKIAYNKLNMNSELHDITRNADVSWAGSFYVFSATYQSIKDVTVPSHILIHNEDVLYSIKNILSRLINE